MNWRATFLSLALLLLSTPGLAAQCQIKRLDVPVTMRGLRPTLTAQINGEDAVFTLDSGAFWSVITPAAAEQYHLRADSSRLPGFYVTGTNGRATMKVATVANLTLFGMPLHKFDFLVGGTDPGAGTVGLLGQNILRVLDIEYDLAQGRVSFHRTTGCQKVNLAHWLKPGDGYSLIDIQEATALAPHTIATAYLNGAKIRATFDTGAPVSMVGLRAAAKAGFKPGGPGVEEEEATTGIGRNWVKTWIATFPTFKIGDEEIHNARLRFGDIGDIDMLVGADFFLSHHIYVASSQSKLYFTYNGGPVFNYATAMARTKAAAAEEALDPTASDPTAPTDAPTLARRAAAFAARQDFEHALKDYNRACELAPTEANYFYQRASTQFALHRNEEGAADIETALKLNPDLVDAYFVRAEIDIGKHAAADAVNDLDAVDRLAPKESAIRYRLAGLYVGAGNLQSAVTQLDLWIAHHSEDAHLPVALNDRCWNRAVLKQALDRALDDCNKAIRLQPRSAAFLDSRGYVHLRRKEFEPAIADYDAALKLEPKAAWSLYCRGIAKTHAGKAADGAKDTSAAVSQDAHVTEYAKRYDVE